VRGQGCDGADVSYPTENDLPEGLATESMHPPAPCRRLEGGWWNRDVERGKSMWIWDTIAGTVLGMILVLAIIAAAPLHPRWLFRIGKRRGAPTQSADAPVRRRLRVRRLAAKRRTARAALSAMFGPW
jgi:hypothetical protein